MNEVPLETIGVPGFMPHGYCFLWETGLLTLHVGSDVLIALAYFSIPLALFHLHKHRPDIAFHNVLLLFAAFILACGVTHAFTAWNMWHADYWPSGIMKLLTALVSLATAFLLWRAMPTALGWPSPAQLKQANTRLLEEIEHKKRINTSLEENEELIRSAFDYAPIGKALVGLDGGFMKVNPALCRLLGYSEEEMLSTDFQSLTHPDDLERDQRAFEETLAGEGDYYSIEKRYIHRTGEPIWALLTVKLVHNPDGSPRYFIGQIVDISFQKQAEAELRQARDQLESKVRERTHELAEANRKLEESNRQLQDLASRDTLSGLANRRRLLEAINYQLQDSRRYKVPWCIMMMDIDYFKEVNDKFGHTAGDAAIRAMGRILHDNLRETDIAGRYGGDEFCVMVTHSALHEARIIAAKIHASVGREDIPYGDDGTFRISCSIGVVEWQPTFTTAEGILEHADQALYLAKAKGRDTIATLPDT